MVERTGGDEDAQLDEAASYLEGLINFERRPSYRYERLGLRPIRRLLAAVGHPERGLSIVHVAGSKGKGSTCLLTEAILGELGERVGTFTSPHLERWSERFRVAGREVGGSELAAVVQRIRPKVEALRSAEPGSSPTFFDATTAAALLLFAESGVSRVLLEVGLGGRLDSTNAVTPAVTCISSIELEHTDKLGEDLAAIAAEKAGILKPGVPCICGRLAPEAAAVVRERAERLGVPLTRLGHEIEIAKVGAAIAGQSAERAAASRLRYRERDGFVCEAELSVLGAHQIENAALAIAAVRRLEAASDEALAQAAPRALARVRLPGRIECVGQHPWLLVDSAHTPASARALAAALAGFGDGRLELVLSVSSDKKWVPMLEVLLPCASALVVTRAEPRRSLEPARLAQVARELRPELGVRIVEDPAMAVRDAFARLEKGDALCATGSVYLAGIARGVLLRECLAAGSG